MTELWKDINGFNGRYQVSNAGRIRNAHTDFIRKPVEDKDGYYQIRLYDSGCQGTYKIHRLVAEAFIDNPCNLPLINHKDEDKKNNTVDNLEWCTKEYNNNYGSRAQKILRKINQIDLHSNKIIKTYVSIASAAKEYNINPSSICGCLRGRSKSCLGYVWRYCD
jgi:hypothetical protein